MDYCRCMDVRGFFAGIMDILREVVEWVKKPSRDELSDVIFGIGRLIAGRFGKVYVHVPGDRLHVEKINARMAEYGCIRSEGKGCK